MRILLVRHAIAEDREAWAERSDDDGLRPLTDDGKEKMRRAARGLAVLEPGVNLLASSPLVRARETAEILAAAWGGKEISITSHLAPAADRRALQAWLARRRVGETVALVGHEPDLGDLAAAWLAGSSGSFLAFKKGGAALIEFSGGPGAGTGVLRWFVTPGQLREIGAGR